MLNKEEKLTGKAAVKKILEIVKNYKTTGSGFDFDSLDTKIEELKKRVDDLDTITAEEVREMWSELLKGEAIPDVEKSTINGAEVGKGAQFIKSAGSYMGGNYGVVSGTTDYYVELVKADLNTTAVNLQSASTSISFIVSGVGHIANKKGARTVLVTLAVREKAPCMRVEILSDPLGDNGLAEKYIDYGYYIENNVCHFCVKGPNGYNGMTTITLLTRNDAPMLRAYTFNDNFSYITALPEGSEWTRADIVDRGKEIADLKSYIGYTDPDIVGLHADFKNNVFTRLAGAVGLNGGKDFDKFNAFGGRMRCIVLDNGMIAATSYDAETSVPNGYYATTSEYIEYAFPGQNKNRYFIPANNCENGTIEGRDNAQVMVYQPKFWYKVVPLELEPIDGGIYGHAIRKANYYVSDTPKAGFELHPAFIRDGKEVDYILLSAYEGSVYDVSTSRYLYNDEQIADFTAATTGDKLSSISGAKPCSGATQQLTRANARQLAHNRGEGWELSYAATLSASQMLMIVEYATFDMQSAIGQGVVNRTVNVEGSTEKTGGTSNLGNASGKADNNNNYSEVSYRGEENIWGNIYKWCDGLNLYNPDAFAAGVRGQMYVADHDFADDKDAEPYKSTGIFPVYGNGYISAFGYSQEYDWLYIPVEQNGTSVSPVSDHLWNQNSGWKCPAYGGEWSREESAGAFCYHFYYHTTFRSMGFGARLVYIPISKGVVK